MHSNIFFILIFTLTSVNAIYDIPSYYGHFSKKFFLPSEILKGTFTYFEYHYAIDIDYNNTYLYYANKDLNCIQRYNLLTNTLSTIGGQCGVGGDRIGNIELMLLNGPESVVYYHPNSDSYQS